MYLGELSGSKFHSVTSSNVILYNDFKTQFSSKVDLSGFGTELFNCGLSCLTDLWKTTLPDMVVISPRIAEMKEDFPLPTAPTTIVNFPDFFLQTYTCQATLCKDYNWLRKD